MTVLVVGRKAKRFLWAQFAGGPGSSGGFGSPGSRGPHTYRRPESQSDDELVLRSQRGDAEAFAELGRRHEGRIYGIVYQYVKNQDDALDITRDVLLKAYGSIGRFRGTARFSSWLCRIAINKSIDFTRRAKNLRVENIDDPLQTDGGELSRDFPDPSMPPDREVENRELGAKIREAVDSLSPKLRTVVVLREIEGMAIEEIAEVLGCSEGTVKSRLFRARERLQALLAPYVEA